MTCTLGTALRTEPRGLIGPVRPRCLMDLAFVRCDERIVRSGPRTPATTVTTQIDGFANLDTTDLFDHGPHATVATVTAPAMLTSMLLVVALTVTTAVQDRRVPVAGS